MADKVIYILDRMAKILQKLEQLELFSSDEVKKIVKKRTDMEYVLVRRLQKVDDYSDYLEYEYRLDAQLESRIKQKIDDGTKKDKIDSFRNIKSAFIRHICYIFDRGVRRFPNDERLWMSYLKFLKRKKSWKIINGVYGRMISLFPKNEKYWILAAQHELQINRNAHNARILYQRSLRSNKTNKTLYLKYFELELWYVLRSLERGEFLLKNNKIDNSDGDKNIVGDDDEEYDNDYIESTFKIPLLIFKHARKAISDSEFACSFHESSFDVAPNLAQYILDQLKQELSHDPALLRYSVRMHIQQTIDDNYDNYDNYNEGVTQENSRITKVLYNTAQAYLNVIQLCREGLSEFLDADGNMRDLEVYPTVLIDYINTVSQILPDSAYILWERICSLISGVRVRGSVSDGSNGSPALIELAPPSFLEIDIVYKVFTQLPKAFHSMVDLRTQLLQTTTTSTTTSNNSNGNVIGVYPVQLSDGIILALCEMFHEAAMRLEPGLDDSGKKRKKEKATTTSAPSYSSISSSSLSGFQWKAACEELLSFVNTSSCSSSSIVSPIFMKTATKSSELETELNPQIQQAKSFFSQYYSKLVEMAMKSNTNANTDIVAAKCLFDMKILPLLISTVTGETLFDSIVELLHFHGLQCQSDVTSKLKSNYQNIDLDPEASVHLLWQVILDDRTPNRNRSICCEKLLHMAVVSHGVHVASSVVDAIIKKLNKTSHLLAGADLTSLFHVAINLCVNEYQWKKQLNKKKHLFTCINDVNIAETNALSVVNQALLWAQSKGNNANGIYSHFLHLAADLERLRENHVQSNHYLYLLKKNREVV